MFHKIEDFGSNPEWARVPTQAQIASPDSQLLASAARYIASGQFGDDTISWQADYLRSLSLPARHPNNIVAFKLGEVTISPGEVR